MELDTQDKAEIAQKLVDLLGRENVRSGRSVQNAEVLYKKHRISTTLPKAWNQLVSEPEDLIVNLLVKKTKELCGEETDKSEVERFLSAHLQNIKITSPPAAVEPVPVPEPEPPEPKTLIFTRPKAFTFNGRRYEVKAWTETLVKLCEIVYSAHEDQFEQQALEMRGNNFSRDPNDLRRGRMINKTGIHVEVDRGAAGAKRFAGKLITHFGYDKSSLSFEETQ